MHRTWPAVAALALCLLALPVTSAGAQVPHQNVIVGYQYLPGGSVNVPFVMGVVVAPQPVLRGDTITWTDLDALPALFGLPHTVTSCAAPCEPAVPSGLFDSGPLGPGAQYTLQTAGLAPGTYYYFCTNHPGFMRGAFQVI